MSEGSDICQTAGNQGHTNLSEKDGKNEGQAGMKSVRSGGSCQRRRWLQYFIFDINPRLYGGFPWTQV